MCGSAISHCRSYDLNPLVFALATLHCSALCKSVLAVNRGRTWRCSFADGRRGRGDATTLERDEMQARNLRGLELDHGTGSEYVILLDQRRDAEIFVVRPNGIDGTAAVIGFNHERCQSSLGGGAGATAGSPREI